MSSVKCLLEHFKTLLGLSNDSCCAHFTPSCLTKLKRHMVKLSFTCAVRYCCCLTGGGLSFMTVFNKVAYLYVDMLMASV